MYTSGPGEAALGASRLLNTPILGAAGAGQVISIIRGEGSHTYGNAVVWRWGGVESWWYGRGFGRGGEGREAGVGSWGVTFVSRVGVLLVGAAPGDPGLQLHVSVLSFAFYFTHEFLLLKKLKGQSE